MNDDHDGAPNTNYKQELDKKIGLSLLSKNNELWELFVENDELAEKVFNELSDAQNCALYVQQINSFFKEIASICHDNLSQAKDWLCGNFYDCEGCSRLPHIATKEGRINLLNELKYFCNQRQSL